MSNTFEKLIKAIQAYHPSDDLSMIEKAYDIASNAHNGQLRKSGEPYIIHPLGVAKILADLELDIESITAGLLHDVVEDTSMTLEDIELNFNKEVALLVDGVTKLSQIKYHSTNKKVQKEELQVENYRKMFIAMAQDIRVVLIKLADRLHNMQTLKYMIPEKQQAIARETMDIYAPIANRLGICKLKAELEDLSLRYINSNMYYYLVKTIAKKRQERVEITNQIVVKIRNELDKLGIKANVEGRPKHFFSIYKKLVNQNKTIDQIYDLFAVRAIVEDVKDCYGVLGVAHDIFTPIPGRFKDYIAMPKPNMYQSLHTTLMGPNGVPFELQIRTMEMHRTAEYGIAAHWKYKEGKIEGLFQDTSEEKLAWLRQILEWQKDMSDNEEFISAIKVDLDIYTDQVYVFSPKGDLITIPTGATPIDFAYYIHSDIGNKMTGAKVNDKIVNLDSTLKNGDRIEILTSASKKGPSRDWLNIVTTTQARNKINQWFRKQFKEEDILKGKDLLETSAKHKAYKLASLLTPEATTNVYRRYGLKNWEAVYAAIGYGSIKEQQVLSRLIDENIKANKEVIKDEDLLKGFEDQFIQPTEYVKSKSGIIIDDLGDIAIKFAQCCNPLPGDEIIGYITRGRGISIHKSNCPNINYIMKNEPERISQASWQDSELPQMQYITEIQILCIDRPNIVAEILKILNDMSLDIKSLNVKSIKTHDLLFNVKFIISHRRQLEEAIRKIININDVNEVRRVES
ncbi:RelA/SpoT family protein [Candidatus Epulonipiscium viviparus]|uniref:RelA/SpoT family protein n=1 Tax=Candidatus Epulonipiscium viviparus TaxID=420336 RepID=UPI00016BFB0F|nr:bifunctional (p)ppGpp synthetase/guanosine-3',5'-bis(diphosphate) 3'-pyrophosphohydrolase [Candidatus Epulopiscium viviparus]